MSHFNVSLIVWAKSQDSVHKPPFLKRGSCMVPHCISPPPPPVPSLILLPPLSLSLSLLLHLLLTLDAPGWMAGLFAVCFIMIPRRRTICTQSHARTCTTTFQQAHTHTTVTSVLPLLLPPSSRCVPVRLTGSLNPFCCLLPLFLFLLPLFFFLLSRPGIKGTVAFNNLCWFAQRS